MAVNLCNSIFGVNVTSSTISAEGYDICNLLQAGRQCTRGAFMAERFIRPPVDIFFFFPFMIEIKEIFLDPSVGNQVSSGFEIFTASLQPDQQPEENHFQSVGKSPWNNSNLSLYHFINRRYRQKLDLGQSSSNCNDWTLKSNDQVSMALRHHFSQFLLQVTHIKIKITRTHASSIPCLKRVKILGQPSYLCSKATVASFLEKVQWIHAAEEVPMKRVNESLSEGPEGEKVHPSSDPLDHLDDCPIPEEFKDSLTFDLMSLPVILPSGHTIDQITLDKHTAAEAEWGRPPSDPFTGVTFSDSSKPVPNLLLKSRLDNFLLKAGKKFQHLPRKTIGVRCHGHKTFKNQSRFSDSFKNESHLVQSKLHHRTETGPTITLNVPTSSVRAAHQNDKYSSGVLKRNIEDLDLTASAPSSGKRKAKEVPRHEEVVRDSLLSALDETLNQLPSFQEGHSSSAESMNRDFSQTQATPCIACERCGSCPADCEDDITKHLYQFPCGHAHRRSCLLQSLSGEDRGRYTCFSCDLMVDPKDISKLHAVT